jgi:putative glutamine amidotransferase
LNRSPLIGVTPGFAGPSEQREFCRTATVYYSDANYLQRILEAEGAPVLLPHTKDDRIIEALCLQLDGLMMTGGEDVDPNHYGQWNDFQTNTINESRDDFEMRIFRTFFKTKKPVLAICRGCQVINVALGGTLYQDLPAQLGVFHHAQTQKTDDPVHEVELVSDSRLSKAYGCTTIEVNSHHHQAVDRLADELIKIGWSEEGIIEAFEHRTHPFLVAVQWHPERLSSRKEIQAGLFRQFVAACGA